MIDPKRINLTDFLATWYDAPSRNATPLPGSCDWLPNPLKEWHTLTSRWETRLTFTTTMISPERIRIAEDGKAIFMVDATGDWRWCIDPDDPEGVFDAERYEPWDRNPEQLEEFLIHNTVREAVYGAAARIRALAVPERILEEALAPMEEVAFGAWKWPAPGYRIFMGNAALAETVKADSGSGWDVEVVASEFGQLSHLEEISGVHWRR
ncbi:hypothetical protein ACWDV4_27180 [Micromonospora sp. NPDC003197]